MRAVERFFAALIATCCSIGIHLLVVRNGGYYFPWWADSVVILLAYCIALAGIKAGGTND